ncbi:hypothetical protein L8V88_03805 [Campylobacter sp. IFREMER_LSEM_CL2101]|uniref:hypothetical protein n=1 Tax=Campylobacter sp. IFREMER_LSEM_CL2101 TaxID=2911618 RepID=UPI0021E89E00|nr:hypothetical protein [Campylobacter sp. IFREMER_LSEM_CL2101]MCV3392147.1 hypothetical protein [Campylobacter sp. IFREMER_LSEM_CL2101]
MYVNAKISTDDLELVSLYEIIELFNNLDNDQQEEFFRRVSRTYPEKTIKALFFKLDNDEAKELLNELNQTIKSDKEWQEIVKNINED